MEKIASFCINHDVLTKGMYVSRIDGDVVTYDVRMKKPNADDYLENASMHTIEHLMATYLRNTPMSSEVVYVGPMGCRTGFYVLTRSSITHEQALRLVRQSFDFISEYRGEIPGVSSRECGNYLEHDLEGARRVARDMVEVLSKWSAEKMVYPE